MIKAIYSKYCTNDFVQLMPYTDVYQLIIDTEQIILLKDCDTVVINKFVDHPNRSLFPLSDSSTYRDGFNTHYNELFEYNKFYLNFRGSYVGYKLHKHYFVKGTDSALFLNEKLPIMNFNTGGKSQDLTREETEKIFDVNNYDSMYVIGDTGAILFAGNKKDGTVIKKRVVPTDDEIVNLELQKRISLHSMACSLNPSVDTTERRKEVYKPKTIDEIKNFTIYGYVMPNKYTNMLITSKNGKFEVKWFDLNFIEKDKFRLTTRDVTIIEPTVDYVVNYTDDQKTEKKVNYNGLSLEQDESLDQVKKEYQYKKRMNNIYVNKKYYR